MALGRGLGELLGEIETAYEQNSATTDNTIDIDIQSIKPNPYQPRKIFDEESLQELKESIIQNGLLQPIIVMQDQDTQQYILIAGERRLRASKLANLSKIKAIILSNITKQKLRELSLIENIQRDDLNVIEIAYSYAGLIQDYNITHEELAKIVSKSRSSITNILRLLTLDEYVQKMLIANKISTGHAKLIISLDKEQQKIITDSIVKQRLSVRETEILIKNLKTKQHKTTKPKLDINLDLTPLKTIQNTLQDYNLKTQIDKNYFKIKIESQEDIEKISAFFKNKSKN
jgi:ParB family chromosome partitioning protein